MTVPVLSVVVPAHNAAATIGVQLEALLKQDASFGWEIVVVDNRSTDATATIVREFAQRDARVRLVDGNESSGPSYARNVGARHALAPKLACCDADDMVGLGWIEAMHEALRQHPFVAGALEVDRLNARWLADGRGRAVEAGLMEYGSVGFAHGCNLGIDRELLLSHPFDNTLRAGEEIDLALRLDEAGVQCSYAPNAIVHYRYRTALSETWRQAFTSGSVESRLRERAGTRAPAAQRARRVAWLAVNLPRLAKPAGRIRWTWIAGDQCGRLLSAWRDRTTDRGPRGM